MARLVGSNVIANRLLPFVAGVAVTAGLLAGFLPRHGIAQARGNPRSTTVQKVYSSAVRIQLTAAGNVVRSASGVAFARDDGRTYILTNAHVVEPAKTWKSPVEMRVLTGGSATLPARVVAAGRAPEMDVAVLEVQDATMPITPLAVEDGLELGDDLVVIGAPFGKGLSVAAGIVSQVEYDASDSPSPRVPRALKTDAAIGYGSSGGGVFDVPAGRLVGLIEGYRTARVEFGKAEDGYHFDVPMPGETFVAPAAKIRRFLAERGLSRLSGSTATAASTAPSTTAKM